MQKTLNGIIPNGALINGVANFYQSTKPTLRTDGSALVIGDIWVNSITGIQGFWNGTYWLSCQLNSASFSLGNITVSSGTAYSFQPLLSDAIFIESFVTTGQLNASGGTPNNATNFWAFELRRYVDGSLTAFSPVISANTSTATKTATYTYRLIAAANVFLQMRSQGLGSSSDTSFFYVVWTATGTPPASALTGFHINYRTVL